ncbi:hypothetical protein ACJ41O_007306 [Fusarium nematophilum]
MTLPWLFVPIEMLYFLSFTLIAAILIIYFALADRKSDEVAWASIVSSRGDRLPDFSYCGYHNSEVPLPTISSPNVTVTVPVDASDDLTPAIQDAIDTIAAGGGGVVELPPGRFSITAGIRLLSHVVVTGSGNGGTILVLKEQPSDPVFTLGRLGNPPKAELGVRSNIIDSYVPIGSSIVTVTNSTGLSVNQSVYISRAATESWIRYNGMADLVRDGIPQTWIPVNKKITSPNAISAINGTQITLKIPLTDALDATYMEPELLAYKPPVVNSEMGLQNLGIEVPDTCSGADLDNNTCNFAAVNFPSWTVDSWASGLTLEGFNLFFHVERDASRITIQDCEMDRNLDIKGRALPSDILLQGSQVLIQDCKQVGLPTARCFSVATDSLAAGPNAVTRHTTMSDVQTIYPHERWAQGLLVERTSTPTLFVNRASNVAAAWYELVHWLWRR